MPNKTLRIVIPVNLQEKLELGTLIYDKHKADGATSPLKSMQDYKWDIVGPNLEAALAKHKEAEDLRKKMEKAYDDRDAMMGDIDNCIKSTRDVLKGIYSKTPRTLGNYGFTVDDTPKARKQKTS